MRTAAARSPTLSSEQYNALQDLYNATNGQYWVWHNISVNSVPWDFSNPSINPCTDSWQGLECPCELGECKILVISLDHHNMSGHLPHTIGDFPYLTGLILKGNNITGTLPDELGNLSELVSLDMSNNFFEGEIPGVLSGLVNLLVLDLSVNRLSRISEDFFALPKIEALVLTANAITGTLSPAIGNLTTLVTLQLDFNYFRGAIPDVFSSFPSLETIDLTHNGFSSPIPDSFYTLPSIVSVFISRTPITGTLSPAVGNMTTLVQFFVGHNQIYGTIPETIGNLVNLRVLGLNQNLFSQTVPSSLINLVNLEVLDISTNQLTGHLTTIQNFTNLELLYIQTNFLHGDLISGENQWPGLVFFGASSNQFSNHLPWNPKWTFLFEYQVTDNYFTGFLPSQYDAGDRNTTSLTYLLAGDNYFSGPIPSELFVNCSALYYLLLGRNLLTGTIPEVLTSLRFLSQLNLSMNAFSGTLFEDWDLFKRLAVVDLSQNQLTGTLPPSIGTSVHLKQLFLQENLFTGNLDVFNFPDQTNADRVWANIDVSSNLFTGTIPVNFFQILIKLETFAASSNCLSGSIPPEICDSQLLNSLILDGLTTAPNCRQDLFPGIPYFNAFVVDRYIQGKIPTCLFEMPVLELLHLSGNGLQGTIPQGMTISPSLRDLSLSHNLLSGTIPNEIQSHLWLNLDLSYNKLSGTLNSNFTTLANSETGSLYLDVNRLSGDIPSPFLDISTISVLNGNIFTCVTAKELPSHDSDYSKYTCGSNNVNYVLYGWMGVVVLIPLVLALGALLVRGLWERMKVSEVCGKSREMMMNIRLHIGLYREALVSGNIYRVHLLRLSTYFEEMRRSIMYLTGYCLLLLLPMYLSLKPFYSSYKLEYIWEVSGILLSGEGASVALFLFFLVFLLLIFNQLGGMGSHLDRRMLQRNRDSNSERGSEGGSERDEEGAKSLLMKEKRKQSRGRSVLSVSKVEVVLVYVVIFLANASIMCVTDFSYVYVVLNYGTVVDSFAALFLAVFRLIHNNLLLFNAIPLGVRYLNWVHSWSKGQVDAGRGEMSFAEITSRFTSLDISFMENMILFNNIIMPALAVMFVLPDCFYNALFAADNVSSFYSYEFCYQNIAATDSGHACARNYQTLDYSPPYIYSFQCSSKIVINYVSVYILMFILVGLVIPLLKVSMKLWYDAVREEHRLKKVVEKWLVGYFRPLVSSPNEYNKDEGVLASVGSTTITRPTVRNILLFSKLRFTVQINSYITILATFGVLFPPLALVVCVSIYVVTYLEELSIGWLLLESRKVGYGWYEEQLDREAEGVEESSHFTLWSTIMVCSLFYGYILFDTMGDNKGWQGALPLTLLMVLFPVTMFGSLRMSSMLRRLDNKHLKSWIELIPLFGSSKRGEGGGSMSSVKSSFASTSTVEVEAKHEVRIPSDNVIHTEVQSNPLHSPSHFSDA